MTHWRTRLLTWSFILVALTALQGCGFHLRGDAGPDGTAALPPSLSPLRIRGLGAFDPLRNDLKQVLTGANVQVTKEDTGAILQISNQNQNRRVLSVDGRGKVVEYEIYHALTFNLLDKTGTELVSPQTVSTQRAYVNPETEVLGKNREEALLRRDMRRDLARRIISRMQKQLKQ